MRIIDTAAPEHSHMTMEDFSQHYLASTGKKILYIHTPYCPTKCRYCICQSVPCQDQETVGSYAQRILIPQIQASAELLAQTAFEEVYFGGGTPTYLSPKTLQNVFDAIPNFDRIPVKCAEGSPNTIQFEHIEIFQEYRFSFLSLGIQSLQKDVCSWQNRFFASHSQIERLSEVLRQSRLYFNYDLISYLGRGDFRDIPGFEEDLRYLMEVCRPSSINIHQLHQTVYTTEKMLRLYSVMRKALKDYPEYECINSRLLDQDAYEDIVYQAQYRFVREQRDFTHYMWNKYPEIPVMGYDIFALGYTEQVFPKSNAGNLVFNPGKETFKKVTFCPALYDDYNAIRREKGLK